MCERTVSFAHFSYACTNSVCGFHTFISMDRNWFAESVSIFEFGLKTNWAKRIEQSMIKCWELTKMDAVPENGIIGYHKSFAVFLFE